MIQRNPILDFFSHLILIVGVVIVFFPIYVTFIGSTQTAQQIQTSQPHLAAAGQQHSSRATALPCLAARPKQGPPWPRPLPMMGISLASALIIAIGKIAISAAVGVCHRVLPVPVQEPGVLDDLCHADAAGGGAHRAHLPGGSRPEMLNSMAGLTCR
jgi:hypothetical protein